jgi:spermidine synthase
MLAAFLVGISAGGYLFTRLLNGKRELWFWFGLLQLVIGAYALVSPLLFGRIAGLFYRYQNSIAATDTSEGLFLANQFLLSALFMLLPTTLMGMSFPLACKLRALATGGVSSGVGDVYAANTLGAIGGASITGLWLIPRTGLKGALLIAALLNLSLAFASLLQGVHDRPAKRRRLLLPGLLGAGALAVFWPANVVFSAKAVAEGTAILFAEEDATGLTEVYARNGSHWLVTNRLHSEGSDLPVVVYSTRKQGYHALVMHPEPNSVIEIGLGTGHAVVPAVLDDRVSRAEVVEISPALVRAAVRFFDAGEGLLQHPKLHLRIDDGRNYLLLSDHEYDLITFGPFTPYRSGVGYLYSRELYAACRDKLRPGGMVMQWIALTQLDRESLRSIVATFRSVFPQVYLWERGYFLGLMGQQDELLVDTGRVRGVLGSPGMAPDVANWGLGDPLTYLASFLMGPEAVARFADGAAMNTDDRPRVEFSNLKVFKAAYTNAYAAENLEALLAHRQQPFAWVSDLGANERKRLHREHEARGLALQGLVLEGRGELQTAAEAFRRALLLSPNDDIARAAMAKYFAPDGGSILQ